MSLKTTTAILRGGCSTLWWGFANSLSRTQEDPMHLSVSLSISLTRPLIPRLRSFPHAVTHERTLSLPTPQALHKTQTLLAENEQLGKEGESLRDEARALREELEVYMYEIASFFFKLNHSRVWCAQAHSHKTTRLLRGGCSCVSYSHNVVSGAK